MRFLGTRLKTNINTSSFPMTALPNARRAAWAHDDEFLDANRDGDLAGWTVAACYRFVIPCIRRWCMRECRRGASTAALPARGR